MEMMMTAIHLSSRDDTNDEDEDDKDDKEEEEEEHLAPADSAIVVPVDEPVFPPKGTEPVIPPPSTDITIGARITVRPQTSISLPLEAEVERLLAMTTSSPSPPVSLSPPSAGERLVRIMAPHAHSSPPPVPSPLLPSSGCPTQIQTLKITSTQTLIDAVTAALPSPLLPPLPLSLYIPPPVDRRDDIPESEQPPRKRLYFSTLGSRYEVGESSTARPTRGRGIDESVFNISGCAIENQVKFATCTLLGAALTWWNGQIRTLGPEAYAMTWEVLKKKMTDKYYPQGEIKKLEIELWNLKVKGNDVQELTLICTKFVANETEKVDKYISGLPENINRNVKSARPKTLDETIELANDLMDQKLRTYAERQSDNKRKADDSSRINHGHQQLPFKRQNVAKVYNMGTGERKPYGGSLPKCNKCHLHHNGPCTQSGAAPKGNGCFESGALGHFKRDCPKLKNKDGGNRNAQGWVYAVGNAEKRGNAPGNPDANVVTG
ncbi:putative reverse transcriptase domain-containing protein, partial [Tanacetum coccineum]